MSKLILFGQVVSIMWLIAMAIAAARSWHNSNHSYSITGSGKSGFSIFTYLRTYVSRLKANKYLSTKRLVFVIKTP